MKSPSTSWAAGPLGRKRDGPLTRDLMLQPGGLGLGQLPRLLQADATTSMVCGFCSTGCGLRIHLQDGQAVGLTPDADYPVNTGMACPKGWEALNVLGAPDRANTPMLRRNGKLVATDWDTALSIFSARIRAIQRQHGSDSVAFLSTGQIVTEEMALLGALTKFGMGIVHGDGNTRQCMATSVVAYKQAFGFDAPPYTYEDLEESDVLVLVGANPCLAHPILWQRVCRNPHQPTLIVIDPRRTETAMAATHHLALKPKSDLVLFYGLAHLLIREGWIDQAFIKAHVRDYESFAAHVAAFLPQLVAEQTGINIDVLERIARAIHTGRRVSFWWTMGVNQSFEGVRVAQSIINLALITGNIGKPGTGANSITGQCNAMGSRLFSNTTNLLGGHDFTIAEHRQKVAGILGIDANVIPERNSWAYHQIIEGIAANKIKALWIIGTNPAHSWINQNDLHRIFSNLDFLVVQDMYHTTESARCADLLLPAAGWGEKDGTFINSERRIGLVKKVARAPGQALTDFAIFKLIAAAWGCQEMFARWQTPEQVFAILRDLSAGQPCDFTGIRGYEMLEALGGVQWPCSAAQFGQAAPATHRRLFGDGVFFHEDGRARLCFEAPAANPEPADGEYPFVLLTGRGSAAQWHTQTRTSKSAVLRKLYPQSIYVEISLKDAAALAIRSNMLIAVESRRGQLRARAVVTPCVRLGQVFIPMHYQQTNRLTNPVFDPYSKQPSYKSCAVRLRRLAHWEVDQPVEP